MKNLRAQLFATAIMVAFLSLVGVSEAQAGTATSISGLYVTGIDANRNGRDDNWNVRGPTGPTRDAYVVTAPHPSWYASSSAKWISTASHGGYPTNSNGLAAGNYTYTLTFYIYGSGANGEAVDNVNVFLALAVDNSAVITVNGASPVSTTGGSQFLAPQDITLSNGFVIGTNTITITVNNFSTGPSGLLVSSISGVVPEAGAWVPLAVAFGLLAWLRFRPRKQALAAAV